MTRVDWSKKWDEGETPWDLGGPHPATEYLTEELERMLPRFLEGKKVLIPGAGRAHDSQVFLRKLAAVEAVDLSPKACELANKLYGSHASFSAICAEISDHVAESTYDVVFDRAMLCALSGQQRLAYVSAVTKGLKPGGVFLSVVFSAFKEQIEGPPFLVSEREVFEMFLGDFDLMLAEASRFKSGLGLIDKETLYIFRKKLEDV